MHKLLFDTCLPTASQWDLSHIEGFVYYAEPMPAQPNTNRMGRKKRKKTHFFKKDFSWIMATADEMKPLRKGSRCSVEQPQGKFQRAWQGEPQRPGYRHHTDIQSDKHERWEMICTMVHALLGQLSRLLCFGSTLFTHMIKIPPASSWMNNFKH